MTVLAMSAAEITRFDTQMRLDRGEIRVADAMELLGLARRQVYRLLGRLRQDGASGLVSRKRGRRYRFDLRQKMRSRDHRL